MVNAIESQVLESAKTAFAEYKKNPTNEMLSVFGLAFNRACGVTGWPDESVWLWIRG